MEGESVIGYQFSIIGDELMVMIYRLSVIRHFVSGIRHPASFLSTISCYGLSDISYRHFVSGIRHPASFFQPLAVMVYRILVIGILYQASGILHPFLSTVNCHQLLLNFLSSPGQ